MLFEGHIYISLLIQNQNKEMSGNLISFLRILGLT